MTPFPVLFPAPSGIPSEPVADLLMQALKTILPISGLDLLLDRIEAGR